MNDLYFNPALQDIQFRLKECKIRQSRHVNISLTLLYWDLGYFIQSRITGRRYGTYGFRKIKLLSQQLTMMYGRSFSASNLHRMILFSELYPDRQTVETLSRKISWSHFTTLITIRNYKERAQLVNEVLDKSLSVRGLKILLEIGYHKQSGKILVNRHTLSLRDLDKVDVDSNLGPAILKELQMCAMRLCTRLYLIHPSRILMSQKEMGKWLALVPI